MPILPIVSDEAVGYSVGIGFLAASAWKVYLRLRKDTRDDRSGEEQQGGYSALVQRLEGRMQKQDDLIQSLSDKLDVEIGKRRKVQDLNLKLRHRVRQLEDVVRSLGGTIPAWHEEDEE